MCTTHGVPFTSYFRHTACTKMINSGMSLKSVQMLMGYSDASITLDIYTHITNDRIKEELNLLK